MLPRRFAPEAALVACTGGWKAVKDTRSGGPMSPDLKVPAAVPHIQNLIKPKVERRDKIVNCSLAQVPYSDETGELRRPVDRSAIK